MQQRLARHIADFVTLHIIEGYAPRLEAFDVVEVGRGVHGRALVPVRSVDLNLLFQHGVLSGRANDAIE